MSAARAWIYTSVTAEEKNVIESFALREGCSVAELLRRAINSMAEESGDEAVFVAPRTLGRPRRIA